MRNRKKWNTYFTFNEDCILINNNVASIANKLSKILSFIVLSFKPKPHCRCFFHIDLLQRAFTVLFRLDRFVPLTRRLGPIRRWRLRCQSEQRARNPPRLTFRLVFSDPPRPPSPPVPPLPPPLPPPALPSSFVPAGRLQRRTTRPAANTRDRRQSGAVTGTGRRAWARVRDRGPATADRRLE